MRKRSHLAIFGILADHFSQMGHIVVHHRQGDTNRDDGHNAESDRRIGHEFVGLFPSFVLHFFPLFCSATAGLSMLEERSDSSIGCFHLIYRLT